MGRCAADHHSARTLRRLNPRDLAGAITGAGEACSNRRTLERDELQRSPSLLAPSAWTSETAFALSEDQPGIVNERRKGSETL